MRQSSHKLPRMCPSLPVRAWCHWWDSPVTRYHVCVLHFLLEPGVTDETVQSQGTTYVSCHFLSTWCHKPKLSGDRHWLPWICTGQVFVMSQNRDHYCTDTYLVGFLTYKFKKKWSQWLSNCIVYTKRTCLIIGKIKIDNDEKLRVYREHAVVTMFW